MNRDWQTAIEKWRNAIGGANVLTEDQDLLLYENNVSGLARKIPVVLRPASTADVQTIVRIANQHSTPLYPISTGMNWGFGSRLPSCDDCAVLDLGRLNKIHEVNVEQRYAIIEPGVTQKQLYDYLKTNNIPLLLNVTGSAAESSIIGNALERGIGYFSSRGDALSGMEVVLGNGNIVQTGFAHFPNGRGTHTYHHGVGPSIDGLFAQSNFGIVTRAGVELLPKPEVQAVVVIRVDSKQKLGALIDALAHYLQSGSNHSVIHVGNASRTRIAMAPLIYDYLVKHGMHKPEASEAAEQYLIDEGFGPWSAVAGIMGTRQQVRMAKREIHAAIKGIGKVTFITDRLISTGQRVLSALRFLPTVRRKEAILAAVEKMHDFAMCVPSSAAMQSVCWPVERRTHPWPYEPDQTLNGMLYIVPFCPFSSADVTEMVAHAEEISEQYGFEPFITLNTINDRCVEAVINIAFDRSDDKRTASAQSCADAMLQRYIEIGMIPYRVGIQDMPRIVSENDLFWGTVREIKSALDPNCIISPGRYNLV
jgi:4-cresol dehydrogenase (hydroxylating)